MLLRLFSSCSEQSIGYSLAAVYGLLSELASLVKYMF